MNSKFIAPVLALTLAGTAPVGWTQSGGHILATPDQLEWTDVPSLPAGAKIAVIEGPMSESVPFTVRLKLPANYRIPPHWHPATERVTVLSGSAAFGMGDKFDPAKTTPLKAGGIIIMPPQTRHFVQTKEETVVQLHGTGPWAVNYVNPADDPRKQ